MQVIFGRAGGDADVQIDDVYLSQRHCRVWQDAEGTWVEDLGTTNGTLLSRGGAAIKVYGKTPIQPGDTLTIGRTQVPWTSR